MKTVVLTLLAILAISTISISQSNASESEKASLIWIKELKQKSFEEQLVEIRSRLVADTSKAIAERTFISFTTHDQVCRVTFVIDGYIFDIGDRGAKILIKEFNEKIIKSIDVLDENLSSALYGSHAWCGAIIVVSKNKKLSKKLSKS